MLAKIEAVTAAIVSIRSDSKTTIKSVVESLTAADIDLESINTNKRDTFANGLRELLDVMTAGHSKTAPVALTELEILKEAISMAIAEAGEATFSLGKLLIRAREACEDQKEFLAWVDSNFSIKKAWAFQLMKVAKTFDGAPWDKVSLTVLYTLASQASEEQILSAKALAEGGSLTAREVKRLLAPVEVVPATISQPAAVIEQRASDSVIAALSETLINDVKVPGVESDHAEIVPAPQSVSTENDGDVSLRAQLAEALDTIGKLSSQIAELTAPRIRSASDMPMLPQFSSKSMYARLGLDATDCPDKAEILEAFKALCKAGYGRAHEAFKFIDEARHELIHAQEVTE